MVKITTQGREGHRPESKEVRKGLLLVHGEEYNNQSYSNKPGRKEGSCRVSGRNASCHCLSSRLENKNRWSLKAGHVHLEPDPHRESVLCSGAKAKRPRAFQPPEYGMWRSETQGARLINPSHAPSLLGRNFSAFGSSPAIFDRRERIIQCKTRHHGTLKAKHRAAKYHFMNVKQRWKVRFPSLLWCSPCFFKICWESRKGLLEDLFFPSLFFFFAVLF